jgi:hypothetical protein
MDRIRSALIRLARTHGPVTVRQLFYMAVSEALIAKTEAEYKQTIVRLALELRQDGSIPWEYIVDRTRWFFRPKTYDSLQDALFATAQTYRQSLWSSSDVNVQVWCESMSIAGVISGITDRWDVPLFPGKGYSSHDFLRNAARDIAHGSKPTQIYLLGDYDNSGRDILRFVSKMLRHYADEVDPGVEIMFDTLAVTEDQIRGWNLPSHPGKTSDSRHKRYGITDAVELEAIPPDQLRELVETAITDHLNADELERLERVERAERRTIRAISGMDWVDLYEDNLKDEEDEAEGGDA